jgi:hypothetical protein
MSMAKKIRSRGSSLMEFTLVGIPLIFVLISTFELARGMWVYHTMAYAVKAGTRYTIVHGQDCAQGSNACTVTISQIASVIKSAGVGLPPNDVTLTFTPAAGAATSCTISDCISNYATGAWPPSSANAVGKKVKISGVFPFQSVLAMFWPGAGRPIGPSPSVNLSADSLESIQF